MKWIFAVPVVAVTTVMITLSLTSPAMAADRPLGTVVAVERDIPNVYQSCVDQVKLDPKQPTSFFFCKFPATKNKVEFSIGEQFVLMLDKDGCTVEGVVNNSTLLITFGTNPERSSFDSAKACLRKAFDASPNKDDLKFIIYSVQ